MTARALSLVVAAAFAGGIPAANLDHGGFHTPFRQMFSDRSERVEARRLAPLGDPLMQIGDDPIPIFEVVNYVHTGWYRPAVQTSTVRDSTGRIAAPMGYASLAALLKSLPVDGTMLKKYRFSGENPSEAEPDRVPEEMRNVRVDCWLHAVRFDRGDGDKDLELIVGSVADSKKATYMTVVASALPREQGQDRSILRNVRLQLANLFPEMKLPVGYQQISPAIQITIEGSLFFDGRRNSRAVAPFARPKTSWEIHPLTSILRKVQTDGKAALNN